MISNGGARPVVPDDPRFGQPRQVVVLEFDQGALVAVPARTGSLVGDSVDTTA